MDSKVTKMNNGILVDENENVEITNKWHIPLNRQVFILHQDGYILFLSTDTVIKDPYGNTEYVTVALKSIPIDV